MPDYTQANRPIRVDTALGEDVLLLTGFSGVESVSQPFSFELDLMSLKSDVDPAAFLRNPVLITVPRADGEMRLIHGLASRLTQLGKRDDLVFYRARVVPWLWFLGLSRESRIYQNLTVPDILEQVFKRLGYSDFELRLTRSYAPRIYCVQYRETHLDFVSRLMEEEGIHYFFDHTKEKHVLVLSDDNASSKPAPGAETILFASDEEHLENVVSQFEREHSVHPGRVTLWDYDYLQPTVKLTASLGEHAEEVYDFPGRYTEADAGDRLARLQLEAEEAERQVVRGVGNAAGLTPGYHFTLKHHYRRDANGKYLVTQVQHSASSGSFRAWDESAAVDYRVEFRAIPHDTPYRAPRRTPRPVMWGSQTALVVGPKGEEVHTDNHGRIKVQFYWDRDGKRDEKSSCWVRVSTPWGGKGYGSVSIPRIGNEVVIAFEEGDPDRPLVIGSVYNADQAPPFSLPGAGIQMGMKSRSSPGGGGTNEITMTDTKGKEMMNVHAQYDMVTTVEHDDTQTVKNDRKITVNGKHTEDIKMDTAITITDGKYVHTVKTGTSEVKVDTGTHGHTVKGKVTETYQDAQATTVTKDVTIKSTTAMITIDGKTEIVLVSGESSISLKADGTIKISGKKIDIAGGDEVKVGVGNQNATFDKTKVGVSGAAINSSAVGTHEIAGALVKIN